MSYTRRVEVSPWFEAGVARSGDDVYGEMAAQRLDGRWCAPYCVYVHVPFCRSICRYCALYTTALPPGAERDLVLDGYLRTVTAAIDVHPWSRHAIPPTTVHFGGGTPLTLGPRRLEALAKSIARAFGSSPACEWAVESTVTGIDDGMLEALDSLGFRRIHLGVQTLDDGIRRRFGRTAGGDEVIRRVEALAGKGYRISADLIIGFEGVRPSVVREDVRRLHDAGVRMFSVCELRERPGGAIGIPDAAMREINNRALWQTIWSFMADAGLRVIHLGQFGRGPEDNLYYTHPVRRENCVAIGPYSHGSAGNLYYGHALLEDYQTAVREGRPPISRAVEYPDDARTVRELERALLANRIPRRLLTAVAEDCAGAFAATLDSWFQDGLLVESADVGEMCLSCDGAWFVGNMVQSARDIWAAARSSSGHLSRQP